ncbi:uncharacterized protein [Triticum aestivum]|uniref:uncharacterized protein isoform X1 n=1 Tax=Triticum aestivum TaxID=4565 RepID=UPI001D02597D|nr:uncharacterized protein LOC123061070 isoform X1 [Triticum aestivum]XP_044339917.1 uncharacterized protein LOC123061070 isoform X1 [Triticum aestivum]
MDFLMQPISRFRSSLLEEVGDSLVPAPVAVNLEVAPKAEREAAQQLTVDSGEAQILLAEEVAANRREGSPPTSELSTGKMNPQAPGWNKRLRVGAAAPIRTPCPPRASAFEKAVRCFAKNPSENVITPILNGTFDSVAEVYDFYNLFSWEKVLASGMARDG